MTDRDSPFDERPARLSTAVALAVAFALVAAFVGAAGVVPTAAVGAVGATALAVSLWANRWERGRTVGALVASLLAVPTGLGLLAVTAGTYLVLAAQVFPVGDAGAVRSVTFGVVVSVVLVTAAFAVVFGALASTRPLLERRTVARTGRVVLVAGAVPFVPGAVAGLLAGISYLESRAVGPGTVDVFGALLGAVDAIVLDPSVVRPQPATFAFLVGAAAVAVGRAVGALPLSELASTRTDGVDWSKRIHRVERWLTRGGLAVLVMVPLVGLLGLAGVPGPGAIPAPIAGILASGAIRQLAFEVAIVGVAVVGLVNLVRWSGRGSVETAGALVAPVLGGTVVLGLAVLTADPLLGDTVAWVATQLPAPFGELTTSVADSVIDVYGPVTIVVLATGALVLAVAAVLGALWLLAVAGLLDGRTGGGRIAGGGLFLLAASGAVAGVSRTLVLAGIVGGLVVADLDAFASTLGREVGRHADTGRPELAHAVGALVVAGSGAVVALGVASVARDPPTADPALALVGLLGALLGAVVLLAALR